MILDTQVNLAQSDKGSFYNQLVEYEYGKGMFYSEYSEASASYFFKFANVLVKYF